MTEKTEKIQKTNDKINLLKGAIDDYRTLLIGLEDCPLKTEKLAHLNRYEIRLNKYIKDLEKYYKEIYQSDNINLG